MGARQDSSIGRALTARDIVFAYQPVIDLRTGQYLYVEALARWRQPTGEIRAPSSFLHLIDTPALADQLTESALAQALDALPALRKRFGEELSIGLNLSNLQLSGRATELAIDAVQTTDMTEWLTVEIVEDLVIEDLDAVRSDFSRLRDAGIRVMLDDFGTGNTTLSFLTDLAYDGLKLDRRYVSGIVDSVPNRVLVEALIRYGHEAGVEVIAEGVEDAQTSNALEDMQCRYVQGYFCGPPLLLEDMIDPIRPSTLRSGHADGSGGGNHPGKNTLTESKTKLAEKQSGAAAEQTDGPPADHEAGVPSIAEAVIASLQLHEPMSTNLGFEEFVALLDGLEEQALLIEDANQRIDVLIEVRHRRTLTAVYFSRVDLVFTWALELAQFCEEHGRSARQAESLALTVNCAGEDSQQRHIAANALVRVLQIRDRANMSLDQMTRLDNSIGVIFSDLGMIEHSRNWWSNSYRRGHGVQLRAMFMTCLNLIEHTLTIYEVPVSPGVDEVMERDLELLDELIEVILPVPSLPASVHASFSCRRHVLVGDLDAARQAVADRGDVESAGILETCHALRADAVLARASNDVDGFLEATSSLVVKRPEQGLLRLQRRSIDRMRAEALALAGRYEEAYSFLEGVLESETKESARSKSKVYAWLQTQVRLDRPFADISTL